MRVAIRALGKESIHQVGCGDLVSLDELTSKVTKVPLAYEAVIPTSHVQDSKPRIRDWKKIFSFKK